MTRYHLQCDRIFYPLNFRPFVLPYILAAWSSFGSTLRLLHLSVSLEVIPITIHTVKLDNLEELIIDIFNAYKAKNHMRIFHFSLLKFINNHCEKLTLFAMGALQGFDLHLVLQELAPMPLLKSFAFSDGYFRLQSQNLSGLHKFLQGNSQSSSISWRSNFVHTVAFPPAPFGSHSLVFRYPLKFLTLRIPNHLDHIVGGIVECVHQYTNNLTYLDLGTL